MIMLENFGLDVGNETTNKILLSRPFCNRGVILRGEYAYFLRFQITQRFNDLIIPYNPGNWSEEQQKTHGLIKSLNESGSRDTIVVSLQSS